MERKHPQELSRKKIEQGNIFTIEQIELLFSNGERRTFEVAKPRGERAVMVVPLIDDNTFLLIREYAAAMGRYELGFPKGVMNIDEDPLAAANREMMEEVGYGAKDLVLLKTITANPGYVTGEMYCVLARSLYPAILPGDEPEPIEVVPWSLDNIDALLQREDFTEGRSIAALLLLQNYLSSAVPLL